MSGDPAIFPVAVSQTTALRSSLAVTDRKSTRLNSSHSQISYAVFCLKKKKKKGNPANIMNIQRNQILEQHTDTCIKLRRVDIRAPESDRPFVLRRHTRGHNSLTMQQV